MNNILFNNDNLDHDVVLVFEKSIWCLYFIIYKDYCLCV